MIELIGLTIETRHPILHNVDYTFSNSRIYGIVAENGSGKTTLFRTLVGLKKAQAGTILFDKKPVEKMLKQIFYFENIEWLDNNLTDIDYLRFVKKMWQSDQEVDEVIKEWNMNEYVKLPIKKYSLGMKQRLVISMYIISNAKYMIMDEITNGLDEENRILFFQQLEGLKKEGKTILLSSHYKGEILEYCDTVLQIKNNMLCEATL